MDESHLQSILLCRKVAPIWSTSFSHIWNQSMPKRERKIENTANLAQVETAVSRNVLARPLQSHCSRSCRGQSHSPFELCANLLSLGKLKTIEELPQLEVDFYSKSESDWDFLTKLIACGYAGLFKNLRDSITTPSWINGIKDCGGSGWSLKPYLITAVQTSLPNLDLIKVAGSEQTSTYNQK